MRDRQRLPIYWYDNSTWPNTIMKWCVYTFPVVCFASSGRISSGRARMRNGDQTRRCTAGLQLGCLRFSNPQLQSFVSINSQSWTQGSFNYLSMNHNQRGIIKSAYHVDVKCLPLLSGKKEKKIISRNDEQNCTERERENCFSMNTFGLIMKCYLRFICIISYALFIFICINVECSTRNFITICN